ncbi:hypothetical protein RRG08_017999 [Elysia crispata]|uniref:Uncharacterized protein n=1 Tax=Elysia crispata TaxID=231223 RepID=A0AAE0ZEY3_9GAST|nr:hypothetical protein RRG08_017999 [Elysia crispata]
MTHWETSPIDTWQLVTARLAGCCLIEYKSCTARRRNVMTKGHLSQLINDGMRAGYVFLAIEETSKSAYSQK